MTVSDFSYIDTSSYTTAKPWSKVDGGGSNFKQNEHKREVHNVRGREAEFSTDISGFQFVHAPANEKDFTDDSAVRNGYYAEVEQLLRSKLQGIKKVVFFDHTIRKHDKDSPRQPVRQVHVDQTPKAAEHRVFRHLPKEEAEELVKGRYQIINVWRAIENPASDFPLAVVDWRSTSPSELIETDLYYPKRDPDDDGDDRGKEARAASESLSTDGYEAKGETYAVAPSDNHKFYYLKDMTPDEAVFIKCFDSRSNRFPEGKKGVADLTPHTAFIDPETPKDAPGRRSIEVRTLVFYE